VEETFRTTPGVVSTRVGYTGGATANPTYDDVCSGDTNHAEAVEVTYDPKQVSYEQLLTIFFENHNPCEVNRQGLDVGTQYRSAIFTRDAKQKAAADAMKKKLDASGRFKKPIATQTVPAVTFYPAEDYHQQYLMKRGKSVCRF
jgi:peptide-methionine (S)-S-oxide reductase